jgi:hypothetical protein
MLFSGHLAAKQIVIQLLQTSDFKITAICCRFLTNTAQYLLAQKKAFKCGVTVKIFYIFFLGFNNFFTVLLSNVLKGP